MLGRLLHLGSGGVVAPPAQVGGNGAASRPILSLESVQEDIHTRNLLFPDAQALHQHRNDQVFPLSTAPATPWAAAFDYSEDVELDVRDVRVIVLQDALGPANASLLFDSHPSPDSVVDRSPARRVAPTSTSQRGPPESPQHRQGAFDRKSQSYTETDAQRAAREYRDELATFSSCIFGNSELMAYKGTSTKVHVVPTDPRPADHPSASSSIIGDGRSSIGRSSARSSKLSQSFSSQTVSPIGPSLPPAAGRPADKKKVLITRLFPVSLSADDVEPTPNRFSDDNGAFPFPASADDAGTSNKKKLQPKQRRTPMYAVVLVIQLPRSSSRLSSAAAYKSSIFRDCGSCNDPDLFFSSSYSSNNNKASWGIPSYGDVTDSSYSIDMEDRIDSLTQHWDIIMRTLTHLQSLVASSLHTMLRQADMASPGPASSPNAVSRTSSMTDRRGGPEGPRAKPPKSTTKLVSLMPNCLADDAAVASEVMLARTRVVTGLSAARVVTGQGRWGIWRDEAIWTSKWATATDRGPFFCNLLTGFLATHTDWLQALGGRKRVARQHRTEEDMSLPARTIIVSDDKMAARRIVFLLSAFLPASQQLVATARTHRPSTSTSMGAYSNSPPPTFVVPMLREESLRRKINRRTGGLRRASHSRAASQSARNSNQLHHQRRASDAASIRTTNLPIPGQDLVSRKSSAATTTTAVTETTTPYFSSAQLQRDGHRRRRPGSSGSVAADDLKRSLKRGESSCGSGSGGGGGGGGGTRPPSQSGLRWGNLVSGLWGHPRRRDSMDDDYCHSPGAEFRSPVKTTFGRQDRLFEMVREASSLEEAVVGSGSGSGYAAAASATAAPRRDASSLEEAVVGSGSGSGYAAAASATAAPRRDVPFGEGRGSFAQPAAARTPDPSGAFESPVKTSINVEDGVIDVDVPFPDYIASFESAISSPSSSGYLSTPGLLGGGLDSFEQSSARLSSLDGGDMPLNAAGWLNRFHPDFALQALPPQDGLLEKVKASLRAEPTPGPMNGNGGGGGGGGGGGETTERWVDVSSVIIADTTSNSITRHVYRRLIKPRPSSESNNNNNNNNNSSTNLAPPSTPSIAPYECRLEEDWTEEDISSSDAALKDAIERVVYLSPPDVTTSKASDMTSETTLATNGIAPPLDVPRVQCKTVILSALEDMIRDAVDHRDLEGELRGRRRTNVLRDAVRQWVGSLDSC
ncbi:hypothetical protein L249_8042 [Ophiocordyceps polyrhachis-furcata BCC 54312]|uniref:Folliculin-interacting protein N-terminal domain-containing protein n=1 Tax=Ophiocordyceps polyrhachis-furcata BCC 54312 TaxID=1330021 RepID=A0A367LHE0_9HYPO|nr:hypothetical protein L249_8042 [Ophiocordyceps polyrhachis-furcata BCC 54312]